MLRVLITCPMAEVADSIRGAAPVTCTVSVVAPTFKVKSRRSA